MGVVRQYTGTAGKRENCQVGVFLCYASEEGAAFIDRVLYLPRESAHLSEDVWFRASAGKGSKGERLYEWTCVPLPHPDEAKTGRWLLMRRDIEDPTEYAYYLAYGPSETSVHELIRIAGRRWSIEDGFEVAKGEVGCVPKLL